MKKIFIIAAVILLTVFSFGEEKAAGKLLLKEGARLAVIGDSITEQKKYTRYMEMYFAGCYPSINIKQFQYGWSGEKASGFLGRMTNDLELFKPDVATLCYGMNDGGYRAFDESLGKNYEKNLSKIVDKLKKQGVLVIISSPGAVDTKYYKGKAATPEVYNETLKKFAEIAKKVADDNGMPFIDMHNLLMETMEKAKAVMGADYDVCGRDGVHPGENGHVVMAYAFLKAMGFDGDIGTITMDVKGKATATAGHKIISPLGNKVIIESTRYPFCFEGNPKYSSSTSSILPFLPFNKELNRFTLIVNNLESPAAKVTWGKVTITFKKEELEKGVNLAAEFPENPFCEDFKNLEVEVATKQAYETEIIKEYITKIPKMLKFPEPGQTKEEILKEKDKEWAEWEGMLKNLPKIVVPVKHTITVSK